MNMRSALCLVFFPAGLVTGCISLDAEDSAATGWDAYQMFKLELNENPRNPNYKRHLSRRWIDLFNSARDAQELAELRDYAAYPDWLNEAHAHYEKPSGEDRCLSVNGTAADQSPGTLSVRYFVEGESLKASEIHYQYWESESELPAKAMCPKDFELAFPVT